MTNELLQPGDLTADFVPKRRESVASIEIENEGIVFNEDRESWHHLNPMARVIWDCCDGTGTVEEIARDISEIFEEDLETVRETVLDMLRRFGQQGILEGVEPDAPQHGENGHTHDHGENGHTHDHGDDDAVIEVAGQPRFLGVPPSS